MANFQMSPGCGERLLCFVGDRVDFRLRAGSGGLPGGWQARLRTNIGRGEMLRQEIIAANFQPLPLAGASWCDLPMHWNSDHWSVDLPLTEVGFFQAKAYALDPHGRQHWPDGPNVGISVHPDDCRTGNIIYCAFTRLHGPTRHRMHARSEAMEAELQPLDELNYAVIPPSGKLRDLTRQLPHIFDTLGCRVLHLLPINPVPTTYARFGRFGSPYACQALTAIDPALAEFDRRTTALDQFQELVRGVHQYGGKLFLDLVINHTGWGASLWENHPEWYKKLPDGEFESPGAWGNIWRDLVELDQSHPALWETLAEAFLTWCRRGVDGFRCDAGYKVPLPVWQFITAKVRQEYPETVFLLEGLGGAWEATETLLTAGGMQWAYSELFQNYSGREVATYLDYALRQCERVGIYAHYSETHDNNRLAAKGRAWSLLRNRLCALTSVAGGFGFTGGVEWLAEEKINVHQIAGLNWDAHPNLVAELAVLNRLLREHPCFFDGARLERLSLPESPIFALLRTSAAGSDQVLVLVNTDVEVAHPVTLRLPEPLTSSPWTDLLGQNPPLPTRLPGGQFALYLEPGASYCLSSCAHPVGMTGDDYRRHRALAAWALKAISHHLPPEKIGPCHYRDLATLAGKNPRAFLASLPHLDAGNAAKDLLAELQQAGAGNGYPQVIDWSAEDQRKVTVVPSGHWLLVWDEQPFRAQLRIANHSHPLNLRSVEVQNGYVVAFPPRTGATQAQLVLEKAAAGLAPVRAEIIYLAAESGGMELHLPALKGIQSPLDAPLVLLANGRGGMARVGLDLGRVKSKYDCLLAANLHPNVPVDRHVFLKRVRLWVNADGFITPLDLNNLVDFRVGPPAQWRFVASAGDGRSAEILLFIAIVPGQNAVALRVERSAKPPAVGRDLPPECQVSLTIRFDVEDRNFHWETKHHAGAHQHFQTHTHPMHGRTGFVFAPASDRRLTVQSDRGRFHLQGEWSFNLPHLIEASRGQEGRGDAFSPGWFEIPLAKGQAAVIEASAEPQGEERRPQFPSLEKNKRPGGALARQLAAAVQAFLVRRNAGWTVIAGYPWFLDWGRDTFICGRGLLAGGWRAEVKGILLEFARWESHGTLPNAINGTDASNRDTVDAPLLFALLCEEAAATSSGAARSPKSRLNRAFYDSTVNDQGRTLLQVLASIAEGYLAGTPNGIRVDPDSLLVWSPAHFTWMDTNHPAGTPREGYPIEIQALWIRLLRQLALLDCQRVGESYAELANRAQHSLENLFWLEERGWLADCLLAQRGTPAHQAVPDQTLRPNMLMAVSLGLVQGGRAQRCVLAARRHLLVPGALRSLAPLPAVPPLPVYAHDGRLLNNPAEPYQGRYEGDEDTRRKVAYHNGTAWTWLLPLYCEALACAWNHEPAAVTAARACLTSLVPLMQSGCLGQLPEIIDGDAPHQQRGCDAQAWSATEALRVWLKLVPPRGS